MIRQLLTKRPFSYGSNYFSRSPLNHESYAKRLAAFSNQKPAIPVSKSATLLIDCIRSCRHLQATNRPYIQADEFGIAPKVSNAQLEAQMFAFLQDQSLTGDVIRAFLTVQPVPHQAANIMSLIRTHFHSPGPETHQERYAVLRLGIDTLLRQNDYANCFTLLQQTLESQSYLSSQSRQFSRSMRLWGTFFAAMTGLQALVLPLVPFPAILAANSVVFGLLAKWTLNLKYPAHLGRLSWRESQSLKNTVVRSKELFMLNRMMTFFEQHNEINLMNFHLSQVRSFADLAVNKWNDYEIEHTNRDTDRDKTSTTDDSVTGVRRLFKQQLSGRKIVIHDLPEELYFVEFWHSDGENFEWVEPDQDPAEIHKFKTSTTPTTGNNLVSTPLHRRP